jgi:hypothetical protein
MNEKSLTLIIVFLALSGAANCQTASNPSADQVVKRIIYSGMSEGWDNRVIGGMGDGAAVTVTRVVAGRKLTTSEMDGVLTVLGIAFADPSMVAVEADRQPKTALFVLEYLDCSSNDPALKKRIADERKYVQDRYEKSLKKEPPKK